MERPLLKDDGALITMIGSDAIVVAAGWPVAAGRGSGRSSAIGSPSRVTVRASPAATRLRISPPWRHKDTEFLVGNIFRDEVGPVLDTCDFESRYTVGANVQCSTCGANSSCGKGCPAAIISRGGIIGDVDHEQCPVSNGRPLLQIGRRAA